MGQTESGSNTIHSAMITGPVRRSVRAGHLLMMGER